MAIQYSPFESMDSSDSDNARDSDENASSRSDRSDTSSDLTELDQTDFPSYFEERNGHLFHSHGSSPYPLPVDASEQERLNGQHVLLHRLLGNHYRGPVRRVLRPGVQRRVLDLCTGTGQWVLDMAREFPHAKFDGLDIVPIATRSPPDNVRFEMADINEPLRYNNGTFDLVHARSISMAIYDYSGVVDQVARVLRPSGLFLACEWGRSPAMVNNMDPRRYTPRACEFYKAVNETLFVSRGIVPVARNLAEYIQDSGHFERISPREYEMPVGDWHSNPQLSRIGIEFRNLLARYAASMRIMLLESRQYPTAQVDALVQGFLREIFTVPGIVCKYYTVRARRVRG